MRPSSHVAVDACGESRERGHERLCELIVAAGKQAGFVRQTLSMRRGGTATR